MTARGSRDEAPGGGLVVVLVRPQLGENIGAAARAMLNCGLTELRLVAPRSAWPNERARAFASGADSVIDQAKLFPDVASAVADLRRVYAATARNRDITQRVTTARQAVAELRQHIADGQRCGLMFGPERTGLTNDDLTAVDTLVTIPLNPAYSSLNLAQAVLVLAYEWSQLVYDAAPAQLVTNATRPATKDELAGLFEHLERELDESGFLRLPEKRPGMVRNIRAMLQRALLTEQEVRTFHGIIKELANKRRGS